MRPTRTSTFFPDDRERGTIFVRIPELLDADQRVRKYDEPLLILLAEAGSAASVRGLSVPDVSRGIALEISPAGHLVFMTLVRFLIDQHAAPATEIEMEFETSAISMTLADVQP